MSNPGRKETRALLDVLKEELVYLRSGEYDRDRGWRPSLVFEDSNSCLKRNAMDENAACKDCVLMQLVPENKRKERIPCRHIPLDKRGQTLDSLYRWATRKELLSVVEAWLVTRIMELESAAKAEGQMT